MGKLRFAMDLLEINTDLTHNTDTELEEELMPEEESQEPQAIPSLLDQVCSVLCSDGCQMVELGALVSILRAASIVHHAHHWQTVGNYGDHLLFERIYNDSLPFVDQVAEKAIGLSNNVSLVNPTTQVTAINLAVSTWYAAAGTDMVGMSLGIEGCVLDCIKETITKISSQSLLSDGLENLLQGIMDKHEEFIYLLHQRQSSPIQLQPNDNGNDALAARVAKVIKYTKLAIPDPAGALVIATLQKVIKKTRRSQTKRNSAYLRSIRKTT